ncbi:MBL fold metallo-hydrolase [Roseovarius sp. EL26]|uniref:MBL fold metallo-hydrolase n=1 Tax=Roseovarius sp. EL26 TaxID=2126672 RepID=UPI000EA27DB3|nr:MBL fold metallo-hydrolase [Roseovarius sp. EL26]
MDLNPKNLPVAEDWFQIDPADEFGIRRIREPYAKGGSIWFVEGEDKCLLVDTSIGVAPIRAFLETVSDKPIVAFASVGYYDHAGGLHQFDDRLIHKYDAHRVRSPNRQSSVVEFYFGNALKALPHEGFEPDDYELTACEPTRVLSDGDTIDLGDRIFEVLHLPGITEGTCGLFERKTAVLFTGEALVWNGDEIYDGEPPERSDDADNKAFCASIKRLRDLPAVIVYPGHGQRQYPQIMRQVIASYFA